jgi:peptide deformylase
MALRHILEFPDSRLRKHAVPVKVFDDALGQLIDDMLETMYAAPGIGLAATQINVHQRIIVADISEDKNEALTIINPTQEVLDDEPQLYDEGCLSVPGFYETVSRPNRVRVNFQDRHGESQSIEADGLLAICLQHEIDHLNGKLFVDYISSMKRQRIRTKLVRQHKSKVSQAPT